MGVCQPDWMALAREAAFSSCGRYRWWLERQWEPERPRLLFMGLNPSSADADRDDPTLRRLIGFARSWGFGALEVLNLFARCSSSPAVLRRCSHPVGDDNDGWICARVQQLGSDPANALWLGWGNGGAWRQRDQQVLQQLQHLTPPALSWLTLGLTARGAPRHPLYAPAAAPPLQVLHPWTVCQPPVVR